MVAKIRHVKNAGYNSRHVVRGGQLGFIGWLFFNLLICDAPANGDDHRLDAGLLASRRMQVDARNLRNSLGPDESPDKLYSAAAAGDASAAYELGRRYSAGVIPVKGGRTEAGISWFRKSAEMGYASNARPRVP